MIYSHLFNYFNGASIFKPGITNKIRGCPKKFGQPTNLFACHDKEGAHFKGMVVWSKPFFIVIFINIYKLLRCSYYV